MRSRLRIGASTTFDFTAKSLTAYSGLLPVATLLEKFGFQQVVRGTGHDETCHTGNGWISIRAGDGLAVYVGFFRLNHLRFVQREPMLIGILKVLRLLPQSTFWRFLASLHLTVAGQLLKVQRIMRQRVWAAAHVKLPTVTLDTTSPAERRSRGTWRACGRACWKG